MGYACPVCETPQADAGHLANHLAFTAIARGGDHEDWLDEHVPGWGDLGEAELAERVVDHAEETEFPQVFEDTTDAGRRGDGHAVHDDGHSHDHDGDVAPDDHDGDVAPDDHDEDAREVLEEARELTRQRREDSETE